MSNDSNRKSKQDDTKRDSTNEYRDEALLKQCLEEMYPKYAQILLNRYQEDLEEFLRDCLKPNVAATAMMMGY